MEKSPPMNPRDLTAQIEQAPTLPGGDAERFRGYGVMALPFRSGHILGLRRFPASSIGPGYTSVWHRDPAGSWTFYTDVAPQLSCNRYFGAGVDAVHECPIALTWTGPERFAVTTGEGSLTWDVNLRLTSVARTLSAVCSRLPGWLWTQGPVLTAMGAVGGFALRAGNISLRGRTSNGQEFAANPLRIWTIPTSRAIVGGVDLGAVGPIPEQTRLGDFWLPQRGLFIIGQVYMEQFDPARHLNKTFRTDTGFMDIQPSGGRHAQGSLPAHSQ